jgi:hypothetical protein
MPPIRIKWKTDLEKGVVTTNFEVHHSFGCGLYSHNPFSPEKRMAEM